MCHTTRWWSCYWTRGIVWCTRPGTLENRCIGRYSRSCSNLVYAGNGWPRDADNDVEDYKPEYNSDARVYFINNLQPLMSGILQQLRSRTTFSWSIQVAPLNTPWSKSQERGKDGDADSVRDLIVFHVEFFAIMSLRRQRGNSCMLRSSRSLPELCRKNISLVGSLHVLRPSNSVRKGSSVR